MLQEISTLKARMAEGGDWKAFRDEIVELNGKATSEAEKVELIEAFDLLRAVGPACFSGEAWAEIEPTMRAEYEMLLNVQAMEYGRFNAMFLDRITAREVAAGRMSPDDSFRELARDGGMILGDTTLSTLRTRRLGDRLFYLLAFVGVIWALAIWRVVPLGLAAIGLVVGAIVNNIELRRARAAIIARREPNPG